MARRVLENSAYGTLRTSRPARLQATGRERSKADVLEPSIECAFLQFGIAWKSNGRRCSPHHCHGMLIAALLVGLINPLSSASLVSFHLALPCLILVVEAVRRLHFTWLRLSRHRRGQLPDAHLAMPNQDAGSGVDRRRHALFGPRRRFGDILAWDSFFHLGHKDQGRCLAFLPCTPRQALF